MERRIAKKSPNPKNSTLTYDKPERRYQHRLYLTLQGTFQYHRSSCSATNIGMLGIRVKWASIGVFRD